MTLPPPPQPSQDRGSPLAVLSLVFAALGLFSVPLFFLLGVPSLLAVIFGIVALARMRAGRRSRDGHLMAVIGVSLGGVTLALAVLTFAALSQD